MNVNTYWSDYADRLIKVAESADTAPEKAKHIKTFLEAYSMYLENTKAYDVSPYFYLTFLIHVHLLLKYIEFKK